MSAQYKRCSKEKKIRKTEEKRSDCRGIVGLDQSQTSFFLFLRPKCSAIFILKISSRWNASYGKRRVFFFADFRGEIYLGVKCVVGTLCVSFWPGSPSLVVLRCSIVFFSPSAPVVASHYAFPCPLEDFLPSTNLRKICFRVRSKVNEERKGLLAVAWPWLIGE